MNTKRILTGTRVLSLVLFLMAQPLSAGTFDEFTYEVDSGRVIITEFDNGGVAGPVDIPSEIEGMPVVSIGIRAFAHRSLTTVTIPEGIQYIGPEAFAFSSLTSLTIPNSVTSIGDSAFLFCEALTAVNLPDSITSIRMNVFAFCRSLTSVSIPSNVTFIGRGAFVGSGLVSVTIPNSVSFIESRAFAGTGLTKVTIPKSVTCLEYGVFMECASLTGIAVDEMNPTFSSLDGVLFDKTKTELVQFPVGRGGSYIIPDTVTAIDTYAFRDCKELTSVTIPNSVTSIGDEVFDHSGLTSVNIGSGVTSIGERMFAGCGGLTSVTIPASVTSIKPYAFAGSGLTSVTIPNSLTILGRGVFEYCRTLTSVSIGSGITSIPREAFLECRNLSRVDLPPSLAKIRFGAFCNCAALTHLNIPESLTFIGKRVFRNCDSLERVTIPGKCTSIRARAFSDCKALESATFLGDAPKLAKSAFAGSGASFQVCFLEGSDGFTTPEWHGYSCKALIEGPVSSVREKLGSPIDVHSAGILSPEISVQQPVGSGLIDGKAKRSFGTVKVGGKGSTKTFTIVNKGAADLIGLDIITDGKYSGDFVVTTPGKNMLSQGANITFKVVFNPSSPGIRSAVIHIRSRNGNEGSFDIHVSGLGVM